MWETAHHDYTIWDTAPNAGLIYNNSVFDFIRGSATVTLAHITGSLNKIAEEKALYPSAGCLVGSIYCTPVFKERSCLRLHNLGSYYYLKEAPVALRETTKGMLSNDLEPSILLIEITRPEAIGYAVEGVNYLRMGGIHYETYEDRKTLLSEHERKELEGKILHSVSAEKTFLLKCVEQHCEGIRDTETSLEFLNNASQVVQNIPFLGYVLFEALAVTLMLHQEDAFTIACRKRKEFNNWNYKELMYHFFPHFGSQFRLSKFSPEWETILNYAIDSGYILRKHYERLVDAIARRARKYICDNCFQNYRTFKSADGFDFGDEPNWKGATRHVKPLLGHMVHREIRNVDPTRYRDFYRAFEENKAIDIWAYWNKRKIALPFNGVLPKGEIGVNPGLVHLLDTKIYQAEVAEVKNEHDVYVTKGQQLNIQIQMQLSSLQHTFRRDGIATQHKHN